MEVDEVLKQLSKTTWKGKEDDDVPLFLNFAFLTESKVELDLGSRVTSRYFTTPWSRQASQVSAHLTVARGPTATCGKVVQKLYTFSQRQPLNLSDDAFLFVRWTRCNGYNGQVYQQVYQQGLDGTVPTARNKRLNYPVKWVSRQSSVSCSESIKPVYSFWLRVPIFRNMGNLKQNLKLVL